MHANGCRSSGFAPIMTLAFRNDMSFLSWDRAANFRWNTACTPLLSHASSVFVSLGSPSDSVSDASHKGGGVSPDPPEKVEDFFEIILIRILLPARAALPSRAAARRWRMTLSLSSVGRRKWRCSAAVPLCSFVSGTPAAAMSWRHPSYVTAGGAAALPHSV